MGIYKTYGKFGGNVLQELDLHDEAVKAIRLLDSDISRLPDMTGVIEAATYKGYAPSPDGRSRAEVIAEAKENPYVKTMHDIFDFMRASPDTLAKIAAYKRLIYNYVGLGHDLDDFTRYFEPVNDEYVLGLIPKEEKIAPETIRYFCESNILGLQKEDAFKNKTLKWLCTGNNVVLMDAATAGPVIGPAGKKIALNFSQIKNIMHFATITTLSRFEHISQAKNEEALNG